MTSHGVRARLPGLHTFIEHRRTADDEIATEMNRVARAIFYPYNWSRDIPEALARHMVECLGVPESDLRRFRFFANRDAGLVQLHNWRKFTVSGYELFEHDIKIQQTNTHRRK